jgi:hypothetical protein
LAVLLDDAFSLAEAGIAAAFAQQKQSAPLWPAPYGEDTAEAGFRFLTECWWTLNEADQRVDLIPAEEYIEQAVHEWHGALQRRQPYILEKSRRLAMSWVFRGLETWQMGLKRGESIIIDQTHANAGEHLWRVHFSLTELYDRRPDLKIPRHEHRGAVITKEPTHVILPNGSIMTQGHQDAGATQGKGKTIVTLEEVSKYRNPSAFWSQAIIVTQGAAQGKGGWVNGICNASPNAEWHEIKGNVKAREVLGFD